MHHISKHRIVPGFNEREKVATEWIYYNYQAPVQVIVERIVKNDSETEDLVAKTFVALLEHERPFENLRAIQYFLYTAARNISVDQLRRQRTTRIYSDDLADHYLSIEEETVKAAEQSAAFHHLIQMGKEILSERCKEVFLLCYIDRMKNAAIARKLNIKEKTVANLKIKAYDKLRKEIVATKHSYLMDLLGLLL
jgi:RNA polymerase sigma-70 factor, ECF subfamily